MSASGHALRVCLHYQVLNVSFADLFKITKRASPNNVGLYKIAIQLFKIYNLLLLEKRMGSFKLTANIYLETNNLLK
jgi:hypothetical protein